MTTASHGAARPEPADARPVHDHQALWLTVERCGVKSFGDPQAGEFRWPVNRTEALACLDAFIEQTLPHFGDFEDAMSSSHQRLFHSLLSFSLNVKMLNPREVIARAEAAYRHGGAPLPAVEVRSPDTGLEGICTRHLLGADARIRVVQRAES